MWVNTKHTDANRVNATGRRSESWCGPKTASWESGITTSCILTTLISPFYLVLYRHYSLPSDKEKNEARVEQGTKGKGGSWGTPCGTVLLSLFLSILLQCQKFTSYVLNYKLISISFKKIDLPILYVCLNSGWIQWSFMLIKQNKEIHCPRRARKILAPLRIVT